MYLFILLDLINDVVGNKKCYDTSAKQDGTIINIRETERNESQVYPNEKKFSLEKGKVLLIEIKLVVNMLYVVCIKLKFANAVPKSCRLMMFFYCFSTAMFK